MTSAIFMALANSLKTIKSQFSMKLLIQSVILRTIKMDAAKYAY